ncbi:nuclear RNA export factor 5-like, partial [Orycteropus afer afer]|uniref:Nuclear RNA export factor 5-like n=1 Tax=Orycteropus afer afer TaxID=1230840 RepID=A0AC54Z775_ORYAF
VPYGRSHFKTWLVNCIQSYCSVPFTLVDVREEIEFFGQDSSTASALKAINYKIPDEENQKVSIVVNRTVVPLFVQNRVRLEQLKLTMNKGYDVSQQALDCQNFCSNPVKADSDLVDHDLDMILHRRNCMAATQKTIVEKFHEMLSLNLNSNIQYPLDGQSDIIPKASTLRALNPSKNEVTSGSQI